MGEPSRDDLVATINQLTNALNHARTQLRRSHDELDWAHEQIRVLRRLIAKLAQDLDDV